MVAVGVGGAGGVCVTVGVPAVSGCIRPQPAHRSRTKQKVIARRFIASPTRSLRHAVRKDRIRHPFVAPITVSSAVVSAAVGADRGDPMGLIKAAGVGAQTSAPQPLSPPEPTSAEVRGQKTAGFSDSLNCAKRRRYRVQHGQARDHRRRKVTHLTAAVRRVPVVFEIGRLWR
jgi:hypothetical protein